VHDFDLLEVSKSLCFSFSFFFLTELYDKIFSSHSRKCIAGIAAIDAAHSVGFLI
jgi:hypothetical protein